jgi:hypothetical protein
MARTNEREGLGTVIDGQSVKAAASTNKRGFGFASSPMHARGAFTAPGVRKAGGF